MKKYLIILLIQTLCFGCIYAQDTLPKPSGLLSKEQPEEQKEMVVEDSLGVVKSMPPKEMLQKANDLYVKAQYQEAAAIYEKLLKQEGKSVIVYYNLGNAYFKADKIGPAILNYERALLLDPGNGDIRYNLGLAQSKTVDKIESVGDFFLSQWFRGLRNIYSTNQWSWVGIITFLLLIVSASIFFFSRKIIWKKICFYTGIACLTLTVMSNIFAYQQKEKLTDRNEAIIFAPTVTLKGSPDKGGKDIVLLHEGTKVTIKRKINNWYEVLIQDGNVGWIESHYIEKI